MESKDDDIDTKINIMNAFIKVYNEKYNGTDNMINMQEKNSNNKESTNAMMEEFFEYMTHHSTLMEDDPYACDIYDEHTLIVRDDLDAYAIVVSKKITHLSYSYISLLQFVAERWEKFCDKKWGIVRI